MKNKQKKQTIQTLARKWYTSYYEHTSTPYLMTLTGVPTVVNDANANSNLTGTTWLWINIMVPM